MVNKFLLSIIGTIVVMVALVAIPRLSPPAEQQQGLKIEYIRQNLTRTEDGVLAATGADDLAINNDLSATYNVLAGAPIAEKTFAVTREEMSSLKDLVITTGFMQLPDAIYPEKDNADNLTKYTLRLESEGNSKTVAWVNEESSAAPVPSIIGMISERLDNIIKEQT